MLATRRLRKTTNKGPKARSVARRHLKHGTAATGKHSATYAFGIGMCKITTTLSGAASAFGLSVILAPDAPMILALATLAGLIGSGLVVKYYW